MLSALAHPTRLGVFRLLMEAGPTGMTASAIAGSVGVPASTLSSHLALMEGAALLTARRQQRFIYYAVNLNGTRALMDFLTVKCCHGRPDLCGFAKDAIDDGDDLSQPGLRNLA